MNQTRGEGLDVHGRSSVPVGAMQVFLPRNAPDSAPYGGPTTAIRARTTRDFPRWRAGICWPTVFQAAEVTAQQLEELRADDLIEIEAESRVAAQVPRNLQPEERILPHLAFAAAARAGDTPFVLPTPETPREPMVPRNIQAAEDILPAAAYGKTETAAPAPAPAPAPESPQATPAPLSPADDKTVDARAAAKPSAQAAVGKGKQLPSSMGG